MKIAKVLSIAVIVGAGALSPALAQQLPGSSEVWPGVYTTPAISAKCQAYVSKRLPVAGADQQRQSLMGACIKKLYAREVAKMKKHRA
jgi:hypothetical protein